MSVSDVHLFSDGNDLVVRVKRRGEWHELIRTHGPLRDVSISYIASVDEDVPRRGVDEAAMTGKHREQILDTLRELADWLDPARIPKRPTHADQTTPLELTTILGLRNPDTDEVTLVVRVADPRQVLRKGYGCIEGMHQISVGEFSADKAQLAERLSVQLAEDAAALAKESP